MGGTHLVIQYKRELGEYYVRDMGQGNGTFVRVGLRPWTVRQGMMVTFGRTYMAAELDMKGGRIGLRFLEGPQAGTEMYLCGRYQ